MIWRIVSMERTIFIFIRLHYIPVCFICAAQHKTYMKKNRKYSFNFSPTDVHKLPIPSVRCCDEFSTFYAFSGV